jgi:hypothetical protein
MDFEETLAALGFHPATGRTPKDSTRTSSGREPDGCSASSNFIAANAARA